jgi:hypothetical protein
MARDFVAVKIIDFERCGGGCACISTPRGPGYIQELEQKCGEVRIALEADFPGKTSVHFVDLARTPEEKQTESGKLLADGRFPAPLVVIDGQARFAGSIQVNRIRKEVEKILNG